MKKESLTSNVLRPISNASRPRLLSGIQPSGKLHLGNYLGALKNFVDLQNSGKYDCYFFIADLHALTENPDPKELRKNIINLAADFFALGLDPKKSVIFQQSQVRFVEELKLFLTPLVPVSELMRMTAFKEKIMQKISPKNGQTITKDEFNQVAEESNMGLAEYPVLMAADILLYDASVVPVGDDQLQHLELARTIVRKFNKKYGQTFTEPKPLLTHGSRIMSLGNPEKKMSKSSPETCLFLDDSPEIIKNKIKRAVTDSGSEIKYNPQSKPAISNLLKIYSSLSNQTIKQVEQSFAGKTYSEFKSSLAELIIDHFSDYRKKKKALSSSANLKSILNSGSKSASKVAEKKMVEVRKKVGLAL